MLLTSKLSMAHQNRHIMLVRLTNTNFSTPVQAVRTTSLCRVLVIPRTVYNALAADFPISTSAVMDNLVARAEEVYIYPLPQCHACSPHCVRVNLHQIMEIFHRHYIQEHVHATKFYTTAMHEAVEAQK
jgi:hypothetical protein